MTEKPRDPRTARPIPGAGGGTPPGDDTDGRPIYIPVEGETAAGTTEDEQAAPEQ